MGGGFGKGLWMLLRGLKCQQMTSASLCYGNRVDRMRGQTYVPRLIPDVEVSVNSCRPHGPHSGTNQ